MEESKEQKIFFFSNSLKSIIPVLHVVIQSNGTLSRKIEKILEKWLWRIHIAKLLAETEVTIESRSETATGGVL